eukprot:COSAG01_NODE_19430_length_1009_cov_23.437363_1_plen_99_part_10
MAFGCIDGSANAAHQWIATFLGACGRAVEGIGLISGGVLAIALGEVVMGWSDVKAGKALKPGQWKCTACYVVNESVAVMCVSCETDRPGFEAEAAAERK